MYKVIKDFVDLKDGRHAYKVGDVYPRSGAEVTIGRIKELSSVNNGAHAVLIADAGEERSEKPEKPKKGKKKNVGANSESNKELLHSESL